MTVRLTTALQDMDPQWIHEKISSTYWARGRTLEQVLSCMDHSLNFAVLADGKQIAYARVVTDYTIFAYVMDVFVEEQERGQGYAAMLVKGIVEHPQLNNVRIIRLTTTDSHRLYAKFGFVPVAQPANFMELIRKR